MLSYRTTVNDPFKSLGVQMKLPFFSRFENHL
jgi:hypothetical protein